MLRVSVGILWMALGSGLVQTLSASMWDFHIPAFAMPGSALRVPRGAAPGPLCAHWSAPSSCPPQGRQVSAAGLLTMMAKGGKGGQQQGRGGGGRKEKTDRSTPEADRSVSKFVPHSARCVHAGRACPRVRATSTKYACCEAPKPWSA